MQANDFNSAAASESGMRKPYVLNLLHIPKTGGSSVWRCLIKQAQASSAVAAIPLIAHDYYYEALKSQPLLSPSTAAVNFICESGLLLNYHAEIYQSHASQYPLFRELLRPIVTGHRILAHVHFHGPFFDNPLGTGQDADGAQAGGRMKTPGGVFTLTTTRESISRYLSHAAHLLAILRKYQAAVADGTCPRDETISELARFPGDKSFLDFASYLAGHRPGIATHQLRYILASLCSRSCLESFGIMTKWTNQEVVREFTRSINLIKQKMCTIRLEADGQFSLSDEAKHALSVFDINNFQVDCCVAETVSTPKQLKGTAKRLRKLFSADRAFFRYLAIENALLSRLHGQPTLFSRLRRCFAVVGSLPLLKRSDSLQ